MKSGGSQIGLPLSLCLCVLIAAACSSSRGKHYTFISTPENDTTTQDDAIVIKGMRDRGGDLSQPVKIDYYFYAYEKRDALTAAADFRRDGYHCVVSPPAESPRDPSMAEYWLVDASERHLVSVAHFQAVEKAFTAEAARFKDSAYDGYEADDPPHTLPTATPY